MFFNRKMKFEFERSIMKRCIVGLILLLLVIAGSCDAQGQAGQKEKVKLAKSQSGEGTDSEKLVNIKNFSFQPSDLTISPGTTVTGHNQDGTDHTITSDTGLFDSGVVKAGKRFSYKFDTPGSYKYHCKLHPDMKGDITVTSKSAPSSISMPSESIASGNLMPPAPSAGNISMPTASIAASLLPGTPQQEQAIQQNLQVIGQDQTKQLMRTAPPGMAIAEKASTKSKGKPSWSEESLSGEVSTQVSGAQQIPALQLNISQIVSQSQSQNQGQIVSQIQNQAMQYSQYYQIAPQPPSKPMTAPTEYKLIGQEPKTLYFGLTQKAVPYTQYVSYSSELGMNSLWIKGPLSWTQYAMVPQGASLSLIATSPGGGFGYMYELYPDDTLNKNGYNFYSYNQIGFYADRAGQHLLFFVINGQPSNIVTIDVVPYRPQPSPTYNYASVTIASDWLDGYDVYVDGNYRGTEGFYGQRPGTVTVMVPGNQYHAIGVYGSGFSYSDTRFFNAGWAYTLNV
jgi:plastocyanin